MRFYVALALLIFSNALSANARFVVSPYGYGRPVPVVEVNRKLSGLWGDTKKLFAVGFDFGDNTSFVLSSTDKGSSWKIAYKNHATELKNIWGSSSKDLYAVGAKGAIIHSTNGGTSWSEQVSGTKEPLFSLWGSSAKDLYAVGQSGAIVHSINSGKTWEAQKSGTAVLLSNIWGISKDEVYAVGQSGTILRTTDQGKTWETLNSGTKDHLQGIFGTSKGEHIFAVGQNGTIVYSSDHGKTWSAQKSTVTSFLTSGLVLDGKIYVAGGNETVVSSSDYGKTWISNTVSEKGGLLAIWGSTKRLVTVSGAGNSFTSDDGATWTLSANVKQMSFVK
jgi:photosystem II stability/assembly factor-like uncharacterized protein